MYQAFVRGTRAIIREMSPIVNVFYIVVGFVLHSFWDFC